MANQEHLDILKQGAAEWNQWRKEHPEISPDLSEANLSEVDRFQTLVREAERSGVDINDPDSLQALLSKTGLFQASLSQANLSGADLSRANLSLVNLISANLRGANLRGANLHAVLSEADLREADLREADLSETYLDGANLSKANLFEADLSGAFLIGADLSRANLSFANLKEANLERADLRDADLSGAFLREAKLDEADLFQANLGGATLIEASLSDASLSDANLSGALLNEANLSRADLSGANLSGANLSGANLMRASLNGTDLSGAFLPGADLSGALLVYTNLTEATLTGCRVYGISTWDLQLEKTIQDNLIITGYYQPIITVDNLEVAQFIYLLLNNSKIRDVIDTVARKAVLILGRFTPERKAILDALREALRTHGYLPILFDFEKPSSRDFTETVRMLAHLSRFIIADLTEPSSIPQELQAIVPDLEVPLQPLLQETRREYSMFVDLRKYPWVLPIHFYKDQTSLLQSLEEKVITPSEQKAQELKKR